MENERKHEASTYHANIQALGGSCDYNVDLVFSTGPGSPFNGDPFTVNGTGPISITSGILQTGWPAGRFSPDPDAQCATTNGIIGGAGGLEIGNGLDLTPATPPGGGGTVTPAQQSCAGLAATVTGTAASEALTATKAADVIAGLGGNDVIKGLAGKDVICGGAGKDKLLGGTGKDTLKGGAGKDKLKGGPGKVVQIQ